jgi:hypothetical protein
LRSYDAHALALGDERMRAPAAGPERMFGEGPQISVRPVMTAVTPWRRAALDAVIASNRNNRALTNSRSAAFEASEPVITSINGQSSARSSPNLSASASMSAMKNSCSTALGL